MGSACKVNEKGIREKNYGNEISSLVENERIKDYSDERSFAKEDWNELEQNEVAESWNQTIP